MRLLIISTAAFLLCACSGGGKSENNATPADASAGTAEGVTLTAEQLELAEIKAGELNRANLSTLLTVNGTVETPPNGMVHVSLPYSGIIKKILVKQNAAVKAGDPLLEITGTDFITIQENYISAKAALEMGRKEFERQQQLNKENATTPKMLEQVQAEYANAKARLSAAVASLDAAGLSVAALEEGKVTASVMVKASISGIVNMENINIGDKIESGNRLLTVISRSNLQLKLSAYEKDLANIKVKDSVEFKLVGELDFLRKGVVTSIGAFVNPDTRAITVLVDIPGNPDGLAVGMYAIARIKDGRESVVVIPETGVVADGSKRYIYQMDGTRFIPFEVETGLEENGLIEIHNAQILPQGAKFVTYGAYYIQSLQNKEE